MFEWGEGKEGVLRQKIAMSFIHSIENKVGIQITIAPYRIDVLWAEPIKLTQVASISELLENQRNALLFFEIAPCHFCGASEVQT